MTPTITILDPTFVCAVDRCGNRIHEGQTIYLQLDETRALFLCAPCFTKITDLGGKK